MSRTIWNVYQAALRENAEIYHFHDPELMPVGALLKMRGKRVVYDVHEDVSFGIRYKQWLPPLLRWPVSMAFRACEMMLVSIFDRVIAVTPSIARKYPAAKTCLVRNFPWSHEFWAVEGVPYGQREPIAVYAGVLTDRRGLREMSQAVEMRPSRCPFDWFSPARCIRREAEFLPQGNNKLIECKGRLDHSQIPGLLAQAKIGLFLMHLMPNKLDALPIKLFEYMAAGLPVVISDIPLWRHIVQSAECGLLVDPEPCGRRRGARLVAASSCGSSRDGPQRPARRHRELQLGARVEDADRYLRRTAIRLNEEDWTGPVSSSGTWNPSRSSRWSGMCFAFSVGQ